MPLDTEMLNAIAWQIIEILHVTSNFPAQERIAIVGTQFVWHNAPGNNTLQPLQLLLQDARGIYSRIMEWKNTVELEWHREPDSETNQAQRALAHALIWDEGRAYFRIGTIGIRFRSFDDHRPSPHPISRKLLFPEVDNKDVLILGLYDQMLPRKSGEWAREQVNLEPPSIVVEQTESPDPGTSATACRGNAVLAERCMVKLFVSLVA
ncbi:hypothetical protein BDV19DRAFT_388670 [Aspergillus venezuelensis]